MNIIASLAYFKALNLPNRNPTYGVRSKINDLVIVFGDCITDNLFSIIESENCDLFIENLLPYTLICFGR